jgi:hypothetical protein
MRLAGRTPVSLLFVRLVKVEMGFDAGKTIIEFSEFGQKNFLLSSQFGVHELFKQINLAAQIFAKIANPAVVVDEANGQDGERASERAQRKNVFDRVHAVCSKRRCALEFLIQF